MIYQIDHSPFTERQFFRDNSQKIFVTINVDFFNGLQKLSPLASTDNLWAPYGKLEPFPAHGFDQNRHLQFTTSFDQETFGIISVFYLQGHIPESFPK